MAMGMALEPATGFWILGVEYEEIEMEYVHSTRICEQNGIQIRVFRGQGQGWGCFGVVIVW